MEKKVGLWIDHKQAIVVAVTGKKEKIGLVVSQSEKQPRRFDNEPAKGRGKPRRPIADDIRQRVLTEQLDHYYDAVIAALGDAVAILIFGPGEAKGELKKRLEKNGLGGRIEGVETVDKMTQPQIAAKVREHFCK